MLYYYFGTKHRISCHTHLISFVIFITCAYLHISVYIFLSIHSAIPARNESVPALGEKDVIVKIGVVNVPIYTYILNVFMLASTVVRMQLGECYLEIESTVSRRPSGLGPLRCCAAPTRAYVQLTTQHPCINKQAAFLTQINISIALFT